MELCHAQYCVPNPLALLWVAVLMTYWAVALDEVVVFPKCAAAATASAASCDWVGLDGAADALSNQTPPAARTPAGLVACVPALPHVTVPAATPWQYCVTELFQALPPTPLKNACWIAAWPDGSLEFHWEPQYTR